LGVVFYQMLTGELPGKKIEAPSKKVSIDVRLDEVVLRALEKKPELRFQQASVLKTQVETIVSTPGSSRREKAQTEATGESEAQSRFTSAVTIEQIVHARRQVRWSATGLLVTALLSPFMPGLLIAAGKLKAGAWMLWPYIFVLITTAAAALGAIQMRRLESRRAAMAGAVSGCLLSFFNLLCLPFAVWSLAVLMRREVKEGFALAAANQTTGLGFPSSSGRKSAQTESPAGGGNQSRRASAAAGAGGIVLRASVVAFIVWLLVFALAASVTSLLPRTYVGTARVKLASGATQSPDPYRLQNQVALIESPELLERVAELAGLRELWKDKLFGDGPAQEAQIMVLLRNGLHLRPIRNTDIIEISFYDEFNACVPIANCIAALYCEQTGATMLDRAVARSRPVRPRPELNLIIGGLGGGFLALVAGSLTVLWLRGRSQKHP
jgi:hypothetical protein